MSGQTENSAASSTGAVDVASGTVLLTHEVGLHARPSVTLTKLAKKFRSRVQIGVAEDGPWVDAKSIAKVMKMKAPKDTLLYFQAQGEDAEAAVNALVDLVETDFGAEAG